MSQRDPHNPKESMSNALKAAGAVLATVVVVAAIVLGGWAVGWWFTTQNTNREAHLYRSSYGNQQTLRDAITAGISQVATDTSQVDATSGQEQADLKAQRYAHVGQVCAEAAQVTGDPLSADQQAFVSTNCSAGAVSPTSQYAPGR